MTQRLADYKRELVLIFFAQIKTIMGITALIFCMALLIAFFWPPTYAADGVILVKGKNLASSPDALTNARDQILPLKKEDLYSEAHFIESRQVIESAVKYLIENSLYYHGGNIDSQFMTKEVYRIAKKLNITVEPASNVLRVTLYDKDPEQAVVMLKAIMNQYIIGRLRVYAPAESEHFFATQAEKFKKNLEAREAELIALVEKTRSPDPRKEIDNNLLILNGLEQQRIVLKNEAIEKKLFIKKLDESLTDGHIQFFSFIDNLLLNELGRKLLDLMAERGTLARTFNPLSVRIKAIDKQIDATSAALKAEVKNFNKNEINQLLIINNKITDVGQRIKEIQNKNIELQKDLIAAGRIDRETAYLQNSYDTLARRRDEAKINTVIDETNLSSYVKIISKPFPSNGPVFPKKSVLISLGLLIGFITGCSLGFLREYFDPTIKKPGDVANIADLPTLFSISEWSGEK